MQTYSQSHGRKRTDLAIGASMARCPTCAAVYSGDAVHCPADGTPLVGDDTGTPQNPLRLLPKAGSVVQGYRLLEVLGEGSMGRVYLAEHERIGRTVAIKMLHPALLRSRVATQHFINEARTVNRIGHRNIIEITDFVETGNGSGCFLVMERLDGRSLEQVLRQSASLSVARAVHIGRQICEGLAAAHAVGVVHRDLKPGNIFLLNGEGDADFAKLIDFGVAKVQRYASQRIAREIGRPDGGARYIIGTPAYMSPEQSYDEQVDPRSDVYSVGVLLYEMVTGRLPFSGDSLGELLDAHRFAQPVPPSARLGLREPIPERLEALILQCLAKRPEQRPSSMTVVCETLRHVESEHVTTPDVLHQIVTGQTSAAAVQAPFPESATNRAFAESQLIRWFDEEPNWEEADLWVDEEADRGTRRSWPILLTLTAMLGALAFAGLEVRPHVAFLVSSARSSVAAVFEDGRARHAGQPVAQSRAKSPVLPRSERSAVTPRKDDTATGDNAAFAEPPPMVASSGVEAQNDETSSGNRLDVQRSAPRPAVATRQRRRRVAKVLPVDPNLAPAPLLAPSAVDEFGEDVDSDHAQGVSEGLVIPTDPIVGADGPDADAPLRATGDTSPPAKPSLKLPNWAGKRDQPVRGSSTPKVRKPSWAD